MMNLKTLIASASLLVAPGLMADDHLGFQMNFGLLSYKMNSTTQKVKVLSLSLESTKKTTTLGLSQDAVEFVLNAGDLNFYVAPSVANSDSFAFDADAGTVPTVSLHQVKATFGVMEGLDVGLGLGYRSATYVTKAALEGAKDQETKVSAMNIGPFARYTMDMDGMAVEGRFNLFFTGSKAEAPVGDKTEVITDNSGMLLNLDVRVVCPLGNHVSYWGGVGVEIGATKDSKNEADDGKSWSNIDLNLAGLRADF